MVISPQEFIPQSPEEITGELLERAVNYMKTEEFEEIYKRISQMDTIPKLSFQDMRVIKTDYIDRFCTQETLTSLTNSARLLASWLDAILEFTVLKHEALILTVKKQNILQKIKNISIEWPKRKQFIERAYKILLFTKRVRPEINMTMEYLRKNDLFDFMDKENMENNKVYLKIKEIEKREQKLLQDKEQLEMCENCQKHEGHDQSDPNSRQDEINRIREILGQTTNNLGQQNVDTQTDETQVEDTQTEETQTSNQLLSDMDQEAVSTQIQTDDIQPEEVKQLPQNEQNQEESQDTEHKQIEIAIQADAPSENPTITNQISNPKKSSKRPKFTSIRHRYGIKPSNPRRTRSERMQSRLAPTNPTQPTQPVTHTPSQLETLEDLLPGDNTRAAQGIIQLLSSKLLSQILSAGDFFQQEISERFDEAVEMMKHKYFAIWYEKLLKSRIFLGKLLNVVVIVFYICISL